ncbi:MAG: hypothetical protein JST49_07615 [Bacteroidetes bacterium]|nr:hypothetical protein [Bacteroidota bacterium]
MKIYYAVLLVCSFAFNCTMAQSVDTIGPKMIEEGLISRKDYDAFFEKYALTDKWQQGLLCILLFKQGEELIVKYDVAEFAFVSFSKPSNEVLAKIKPSLDDYTQKLYKLGLINDDVRETLLYNINEGKYIEDYHITDAAIEEMRLVEIMQPAAIIQVAEALYKAKLVSTKYEQLLQDIAAKKLKAPDSFLFYLDNVVFVNDSLFTNVDTTRPLFENVYKRTASILPQLAFSNYTFELEENYTFEDWITVDYKVALSIQGKVYRYKSYFSSKSVEEESSKLDKTPSSYFNVFNKALADMQSAYRLLTVPYGNIDDAGNSPTFAVLALTQQQIDTLGDAAMFIGIEPEYYKRSSSLLSKQQIDEALATFKQIGLFKHLSDEAIDSARLEIDMMLIDDINLLLSSFPDVIHPIYYEMVNMDNPYEELLQGYAAISHGEFNPTDIKENFNINRKHGKIQFKLNGTQYKYKLKIDSDWIDDGFLNFIDSVVKANHLNGTFYELLLLEGIIYLTPQQFATIKQKRLIDFPDDFAR